MRFELTSPAIAGDKLVGPGIDRTDFLHGDRDFLVALRDSIDAELTGWDKGEKVSSALLPDSYRILASVNGARGLVYSENEREDAYLRVAICPIK